MRLVFMGTPDFAVPVLDALCDAGHTVLAAYTQPARPAGRGKALRPSPVAQRAEARGIPVKTPLRFRDPAVLGEFQTLAPDAAIVVAYGQILPVTALQAPRYGCLNAHASLLPRWRGAAPIQRAIMAGDGETGVCIMAMEAGLDTGPVLARAHTPIAASDTAGTVHDRLASLSASLMIDTLPRLAAGQLTPKPQPEDGVTYAAKIDKAEAHIDWARPAEIVSAHIRGLSPFPAAWCEIAGARVKVLMAEPAVTPSTPSTGPALTPGTTLDDSLTIACAPGALRLIRLQRAGKGVQEAAEMLRGFPVPAGTSLT
ncbi:MAG: methionyl-tRNA formyltransferase [Pseudomonadota bacterium]